MKPFRTEKVGREIRQLVSAVIAHKLQDPRISEWTSVTKVEVSGDLEWAKVYVSVLGDDAEQQRTMQALQHATQYIQRRVFKELAIRQCPRLSFFLDESIKKTQQVTKLIDDSMAELQQDEMRRLSDSAEEGSSGGRSE